MYRVKTTITFVQQPTTDYPNRKSTLLYSFCHDFECEDGWRSLTNKAKITVPKNVYVRNEFNVSVPIGGSNVPVGGFYNGAPLFLRGDQVTIEAGYIFNNPQGYETALTAVWFTGFISSVTSKKPVVLECEDNMWKLKQLPAPNKLFPAKQYTLEGILKELLVGTPYTVNVLTDTSFGDFRTQNETVAEVLARLRKDYHFESYFRGNELRTGSIVYVEQDAIDDGQKIFRFQQNIISDDLEYQRKDDIKLSAIAYSINKFELSGTTRDGHKKTKCERLEVLVNFVKGEFVGTVKPAGQRADFAPNTEGERRTLYFWNVTNSAELIQLATDELKKFYYDGFRGKFTTFGIPNVRQGDNVDITDAILPDRNGRYKVKEVRKTGGVGGLRQEISLDYKIANLDANGKAI